PSWPPDLKTGLVKRCRETVSRRAGRFLGRLALIWKNKPLGLFPLESNERIRRRLELLLRTARQQRRRDTLSGSDLSARGLGLKLSSPLLSSLEPFLSLLRLGLLRLLKLRELRSLRLQLVVVLKALTLPSNTGLDDLVERLLRRNRLKLRALLVGFFRALSGG